ncbi:MAG TPA: S-adenosylmethionine decarboxylase [Candidatus Paceibacterota bacterium]|nr:S-adenosylmethionine decarboxylase [Candidatus Paceibacterota bacterium]
MTNTPGERYLDTWVHIFNFYGCAEEAILRARKETIDAMVADAGFGLLGSILSVFPGEASGYTYVAAISESGVDIHTWPEYGMSAQFEIHYCNYSRDNDDKAKRLMEAFEAYFKPEKTEYIPPIAFPL